jgi:fatty acid desaturase
LTPYFSWKSTHRRHHIYANNLAKDHQWVPFQREEYAALVGIDPDTVEDLEEMLEDAPIAALIRSVRQQLFGWPMYLMSNITASNGAPYRAKSKAFLANGHFLPSSTLFRPEEAHLVVVSNIGLAIMIGALFIFSKAIGFWYVFSLYGQCYLWCNHWIVAITFLHHTDPKLPRYDPEAWTFLKGALATMDRNLGWAGKHLLHNIADYHVIHHLFP